MSAVRAPATADRADRVGAVRERLVRRLADAGVPTPEVDADLLLAHALGVTRPQVRAHAAAPLAPAAAARLAALARRRCAREPLQRLVGEVGFRHLTLRVAPGVLVPRPETEVLAGHAIAATRPGDVVVDVGTGTGAVAVVLADEARPGLVLATDVDPLAVAAARRNAARHGCRVDVRRGDLLAPLPRALRRRVGVVVSNPPYLTGPEIAAAEPEVARFEPRGALLAGPTGHEVTDRLLAAAGQWLAPAGALLLEVAAERAGAVAARAEAAGLRDVVVHRDLAGRDRVVAARR